MLIEIVISPQTVLIGDQATAFYQFLTRMKDQNYSLFCNAMKLESGNKIALSLNSWDIFFVNNKIL